MKLGYIKGEVCNRNGCEGIICEHPKEGCCSCHINPPCGYCTTDSHYCSECEWEAADDKLPELSEAQKESYRKQAEEFAQRRELFYKKFSSGEGIEVLEIRNELHTHFSQKLTGIFPQGTETMETLLPKVKGTFGGRFIRFEKFRFEYMAYTD